MSAPALLAFFALLLGPTDASASAFAVERWSGLWSTGASFVDEFDDGVLDPALHVFCGSLAPPDETGGVLLLQRTTPPGSCTPLPGLGQQEVAWLLVATGEMSVEATYRFQFGVPGEAYGIGIGDPSQPDFVALGAFSFLSGATPKVVIRMLDESNLAIAELPLPGDATALPHAFVTFELVLELEGGELRPRGRVSFDAGPFDAVPALPGAIPGELLASAPHATNLFALIVPAPAGEIDDFQSGTPEQWSADPLHPTPPTVVANAGPAGPGDFALEVVATGGSGPGARLETRNTAQWTGSLRGAGVTAIALDARALGPAPVVLRAALDGAGGAFASAAPVSLVPTDGWQQLLLPIEAGDLVSVGGTDVVATLSAVSELRLLSSASPSYEGDALAGSFQLDDLFALSTCNDGRDNDGDGRTDWDPGSLGDPGCSSPADGTERNTDGRFPCDDELDNDGDGRVDFDPATSVDPLAGSGDPGCTGPSAPREDPGCDDDLDNDGDGRVDWNGDPEGLGEGPTAPDPQCRDHPSRARENPRGACGLGFEIVLVGVGLAGWRRIARGRRGVQAGPS